MRRLCSREFHLVQRGFFYPKPPRVSLLYLGLYTMTDSLTLQFMLNTLGPVVSAVLPGGLETEINPWKLTTYFDQPPVKPLGLKAQASFLGWQYSVHILTYH